MFSNVVEYRLSLSCRAGCPDRYHSEGSRFNISSCVPSRRPRWTAEFKAAPFTSLSVGYNVQRACDRDIIAVATRLPGAAASALGSNTGCDNWHTHYAAVCPSGLPNKVMARRGELWKQRCEEQHQSHAKLQYVHSCAMELLVCIVVQR
ncbi:hypothetical protein E2C01_038884 [Portunus trituberculatus]|uniref:Uncharacterized protein n=1 Tax=Portunus trituberculatus TaxID=210409 RepID=A0A5B7FL95_PORTR|nr:hypothetical protein [Portunus trituberculatus]